MTNNSRWALTTILTLLCAMLIIPFASADGFTVNAPQTVYAESCASATYNFYLQSLDSSAIRPFIDLQPTKASKWLVYDPQAPLLIPGETETVTVHARVPCKTEGSFPIEFEVSDGSHAIQFEQTLQVSRTNNIGLGASQTAISTLPCTPQYASVTISNVGLFADVFSTEITGKAAKYITVAPQRKILFPGQSQEILLFINTPCDVNGNLPFTVETTTESAGFKATLPFEYVGQPTYDFTVQAESEVQACLNEPREYTITITNDMHFTNTFEIETEVDWATPALDKITLTPGQSAQIPITVFPLSEEFGYQDLLTFFEVEIEEQINDNEVTLEVPLTANNCYDPNVAGEQAYTVCPGESALPIVLQNFGSKQVEFGFDLQGPEFLQLRNNTVTVGPQSEVQLPIFADLISDPAIPIEQATYDASLYVQKIDNEIVYDQIDFTIATKDLVSCYDLTLSPQEFVLEDGLQAYAVNVTNVGYKDATYNVESNDPRVVRDLDTIALRPQQSTTLLLQTNLTGANATAFIYPINFTTESFVYEKTIDFTAGSNFLFIAILVVVVLLLILLLLLLLLRSGKKDTQQTLYDAEKEEQKATKKDVKAEESIYEADHKYYVEEEKKSSGFSWWWILVPLLILLLLIAVILIPLSFIDTAAGNQTNTTNATITNETVEPLDPVIEENVTDTTTTPGNQTQSWYSLFWDWLVTPFVAVDADNSTITNETVVENQTETIAEQDNEEQTDEPSEEQLLIEEQQRTIEEQNAIIDNLSTLTGPLTQRQISILTLKEIIDQIEDADLEDESIVYQIIEENGVRTIDLAEVFNDPDNDALEYYAFEPENVDIDIEGSLAYIEPEDDFIGVEYTILYAKDEQGAIAQTPIINLVIVPNNMTQELDAIRDSDINTDQIEQLIDALSVADEETTQPTAWFAYGFVIVGLVIFLILVGIIIYLFASVDVEDEKSKKPKKKTATKKAKKKTKKKA